MMTFTQAFYFALHMERHSILTFEECREVIRKAETEKQLRLDREEEIKKQMELFPHASGHNPP